MTTRDKINRIRDLCDALSYDLSYNHVTPTKADERDLDRAIALLLGLDALTD